MYVRRDLEDEFLRISEKFGVSALVGPRQSGKTTMLKELMKGRDANYVSFDDPDARALFEEDVKKFAIQYMERELTVLDEVQYCENAGLNLKYLADSGHRMWLTSSSEMLLGKDVLSYLVGRAATFRLYPFNLSEFLRAKGQRALTGDILKRMVWEHATYGGYPAVVLSEGNEMKKEILRNLRETMLLKDVSQTFSIENIGALERLIRYLAVNSGSIAPHSKVSDDLKISFQTFGKYMDALSKSYVIVQVPPFFTNRSKEIVKHPKVYFTDTGMKNSVAGAFPSDMDGRLFENYVLSELIKAGHGVRYWRTKSGAEVDFIVEKEGKPIPVEVKLRATPDRVEKGLRSFIKRYSPEKAVVVSYDGEKGESDIEGVGVVFTDVMGMLEEIG